MVGYGLDSAAGVRCVGVGHESSAKVLIGTLLPVVEFDSLL